VAHERPRILPGGRGVLFAVGIGNFNDEHIEVLSIDTGERHVVIENTFMARYIPTGHLLFSRNDVIFAVPFDLERLEVTGPEVPVLSGVQIDSDAGRVAEFAVSRSGTLVYIPAGQGFGERQLAWVDRQGKIEFLAVAPGFYKGPRLSPSGNELAITHEPRSRSNIALYDLHRKVLTQFTFEGSSNHHPLWSPDGSKIAFASNRSGQWNLFVKPVTGIAVAVNLQKSENIQYPESWSPDGSLLAYLERSPPGDQYDVWLLPMDDEDSQPIPFLVTGSNNGSARFSPTGGWIAYVSDEEGQLEVFVREVVRDAIGSGRKRKISRDGGLEPVWSRDGSELFYRSSDGTRLLSVPIGTQPEFEIGEEKIVLEELRMPEPQFFPRPYDVSPDGERFLMVLEKDTSPTMKLNVVLNWFEELKRLVPTN